MEMNNEKRYETIYIEGYYHKVSSFIYDRNDKVRFVIGSFLSRQLLDNCLTLMQKGTSVTVNGTRYATFSKSYIAKALRVKDENSGDGTHGIIYTNNSDSIRVYNGENKVDKVFEYLKHNTECGLLYEWKSYFYNELVSRDNIYECEGFDYTGQAPTILILDKIDTQLVRNIKAIGLKSGHIELPVEEVEEIDPTMSFLNIIEDLIIPYIEGEECHYTVGDDISPVLTTPIYNSKTKEIYLLYPRQRVIAQGLLNAIKSGINSPIFNGGTGIGKTYTSIKLAYAIIKEHFKKENARIGVMLPGHLRNKWIRQFEECLNPMGIYPKFYIIEKYTDIDKLSKKPNGIEVILFPKDTAKRSYLHEYNCINKHRKNTTFDFINNIVVDEKDTRSIIMQEYDYKLSEMKLAAVRLEQKTKKKVVLYSSQLDEEGNVIEYKVVTTSKVLLSAFSKSNKAYDFIVDDIQLIKDLVIGLSDAITKEENLNETFTKIENPLVCPSCGGAVYEKADMLFDVDKCDEYRVFKPESQTNENKKCNHYIKADESVLSKAEIQHIRNKYIEVRVVNEYVNNPYLDEDGNTLIGDELLSAKKKGYGYILLIKKCNHKLWGAKDQVGYRCIDSVKCYLKKFGKKSIDVSIEDEVHQLSKTSNQGNCFGYLCQATRVNLPLTGTLTGGKSSDLYYLLWRLAPKKMVELGYTYNELGRFIDNFGRRKRVTKEYTGETYNKSGGGRIVRGSWTEVPGISPILYNTILSERMVSRKIEDMAIPLPKLRYIKHAVEMDEDLTTGYNDLKNQIVSFIAKHKGINIGGAYINSLLSYPDMPIQPPIYACNKELHVATPMELDIEDRLFAKERKLIEIIEREISENRRVLVYSVFSGTKGVSKRLMDILKPRFKVAELTSTIKLEKREDWIQKQYDKGVQVIVTNPKTVETGLDIVQYPSIYYYECSYDVKCMRQSEKRAYRPGQKHECRIYYSYYKNTF